MTSRGTKQAHRLAPSTSSPQPSSSPSPPPPPPPSVPQQEPSLLMSTVALSVTALTLFLVGTALFVEPTRVLVLYAQNEALRLNAVAIDLARLVGTLLFALAAVAFILLGVRHNESRASLCFAFAYIFFFAALAHALAAVVDHGTWAKGLARAPFQPVYVLYVRYYVPLALAVINFVAAWCDDIADPSPPPTDSTKSKPE